MRLTNSMRDAFIRAAMDDVPSIDYAEKIREKAIAFAVGKLPPKVKAVWNDKKTRSYVSTYFIHINSSIAVPAGDMSKDSALYSEIKSHVLPLIEMDSQQRRSRAELAEKLRQVAYSCSTVHALAEAMPEFKKYLPKEDEKSKTLPAISGVVADFVRAGWPKGKAAK